jgi:hypothetical protein
MLLNGMQGIQLVDGVINVIRANWFAYAIMMKTQNEERYEQILNILLAYLTNELKYNITMPDELYYKFKELKQMIEDCLYNET